MAPREEKYKCTSCDNSISRNDAHHIGEQQYCLKCAIDEFSYKLTIAHQKLTELVNIQNNQINRTLQEVLDAHVPKQKVVGEESPKRRIKIKAKK